MTVQSRLQEHYEEPYHRGECENVTASAEAVCDETNCHLRIELCLDEDTLAEIWWDGQGCVCCEGFASLLASEFEGHVFDNSAVANFQSEIQSGLNEARPCMDLVTKLLSGAAQASQQEDDWSEAGEFGGPSLGEEC